MGFGWFNQLATLLFFPSGLLLVANGVRFDTKIEIQRPLLSDEAFWSGWFWSSWISNGPGPSPKFGFRTLFTVPY